MCGDLGLSRLEANQFDAAMHKIRLSTGKKIESHCEKLLTCSKIVFPRKIEARHCRFQDFKTCHCWMDHGKSHDNSEFILGDCILLTVSIEVYSKKPCSCHHGHLLIHHFQEYGKVLKISGLELMALEGTKYNHKSLEGKFEHKMNQS